jgi:hypothetical protein
MDKPQVLENVTEIAAPDVHVPLNEPEVGQLHDALPQVTDEGVKLQVMPVKLFATCIVPPVSARPLLLLPVKVTLEVVLVVTSNSVFPAGVVNTRRIPVFAKV